MHVRIKLTIVITTLLLTFSCFASDKILVLWDSSEFDNLDYTYSLTHQKLEVIFNHLGMQFDYLDINKEISNKYYQTSTINNYIGLVSWLTDNISKNPKKHQQLLSTWWKAGKKISILGDFGFTSDFKKNEMSIEQINTVIKKFGISTTGEYYTNPLTLQTEANVDTKDFEFERSLSNEIPITLVIKNNDTQNKVWLSIHNKINNDSSAVIFNNSRFFYAQSGYLLFANPTSNTTQWRLNPFKLAGWYKQNEVYPIADTTTLLGSRIWYSHIDGDAFISISEIDRKSYCGKIIREKVIEKYGLPVSASIVTAEINPLIRGNSRIMQEAKTMMLLENVEMASHTASHPLSWLIQPSKQDIEIYIDKEDKYKGGPILAYSIPNYNKLNYKFETIDSINYLNQLVEDEKTTDILFWSGSCKPPYQALKILEDNDILNLNGGDSRFDRRFPSYSHLFPLYRKVNSYYQIYSSNSNENTYTNLWEGPFSGFNDVIETFENTENPVRIKPINIYYHFYSGEKTASLNAVQKANEWSLKQQIIPVYASEYIKIVKDFTQFKYKKIAKNTFKLYTGKNLKTIRFERTLLVPNYEKSKNVIGHQIFQGNLYIFLGDSEESYLALANESKHKLRLVQSNAKITNYNLEKDSLSFDLDAYMPVDILFETNHLLKSVDENIKITLIKPNTFQVTAGKETKNIQLKVVKQ